VHLCNQCCYGKAVNITHSEYVFVDLVILHAKHMCLSYCHLWLVCFYNIFPHYLITVWFLGKKVLNIKCVLIFSTNLSETFIIPRRIQQGIIIRYIYNHVNYPLLLPNFNESWIFLMDFKKILKYQILLKSVQWKQLFHVVDRHNEANNCLLKFCKRA